MATLADSLVSSTSRPLALRMRPDLSARIQKYHGEAYWVVKEPVGLNYFRFHEEEFAILKMLDGKTSLDAIKERFESEFAPQKITFQDLQQFIGMLHRSTLVISETSGQGRQLRQRRDEKKRKELLGKFTNIFAFRYRGVDPEAFLNWLYRFTFWMFHPFAVFCCIMLVLSALLLIGVQFEVFQARLPGFHEFFDPRAPTKWLYLALVMGAVKVVHEFGHGLSCKHFGGECHEIGFMLLVFTPCLYCNVSDSWMLPSKWRRAMIGAAGMYVEVVMASAATFVWWFSDPATLMNQMCLNVMFICSVSTLVFNGNPLLRFDGYYIMMDLTEIPNLRQKATEVLKRFLVGLCLGLEQPENPFLPQKNRFFFGFYSIAAVCYRWLVVFSIMMFMNQVLEPYGLKVIGRLLGLMGFFGLVVQPLWQMGKFFYMPGRMHKVKKVRVAISLAVVVSVIAAIVLVPLPHSVKCTFEVGPREAASVYVREDGRVEDILVEEGQHVTKDQTLVLLSNSELEIRYVTLDGRRKGTEVQISSRERERFDNPQAGGELDELEKVLATTNQQIMEQEKKRSYLKIKADVDGIVIPAPPRPKREEEGKLIAWSGSPLDRKNLGATYMASDLICRIGDPSDLEALLVVDQADIDLVDEVTQDGGEPEVKLQVDAYPGRTLVSRVIEVARVEMKVTPMSLSAAAGGQLETKTDQSGVQRPMSTSYQARVPLGDQGDLEGLLCTGMRGRAQIYTKWQSLGKRLHRYIARTFHFEL